LFSAEDKDIVSARKWLQTLADFGEQPFPFFYAFSNGRVRFVEKKFKEANAAFESALNSLNEVDFTLFRIEVLIWHSICLNELARKGEATQSLRNAIQIAQAGNIIRPFVEMHSSLMKLIESSRSDEFTWVLNHLHRNGARAEGQALNVLKTDLTRREREILQLLAVGLSNQEMAEKLFIAEGTLKRHVANLYQKLGVHNRTQAIRYLNQP
jgi:DNA-binding CsgD family transcriptional regulator